MSGFSPALPRSVSLANFPLLSLRIFPCQAYRFSLGELAFSLVKLGILPPGGGGLYRKLVGVLYVMNIAFQSFITLASPIALCFFISWLLERYAGAERWIYVPFLIVGVLSGFYSMVKFVIAAMSGYERLESLQSGKGRGSKNGKSGDA